MDEHGIRSLIDDVKSGRQSRRSFIHQLMCAGLSGPLAAQILMHHGAANAQAAPIADIPLKRGGGGALKILCWQAPTLLNPHFATGSKDQDAARMFYEPLASWDNEGNLVPVLAAELPTRENGGVAGDGLSVVWKLKRGVTWHDGRPFTADDVVFNWQYATNPATAAATIGSYARMVVEKMDDHTVKLTFEKPQPFWANAFVGVAGMIIPKHQFSDYVGAKSREAPANLKPVGTGPYKFVEFRPGDILKGELNTGYHVANRPHFDTFEMKGGGDAVSAARAVLQTGEFDFAPYLIVEDDVLTRMERGGKGRVVAEAAPVVEHIQCNFTDPNKDIDGERSSLKSQHPSLSDKAVRQALNCLIDRSALAKNIYGRLGNATANFVDRPERIRSKTTSFEFDVAKANAILDAAGWVRGADGIRAKGDVKLKWVFQTTINSPRQKTQAVVKQACQKAGIDIELKSVPASVFFSTDEANPDTYSKFYADLQMYATNLTQPDGEVFFLMLHSSECAQKANKWQGRNLPRFQSSEFDAAHRAATLELDPVKRAAQLIRCNDIAIEEVAVIPVVSRAILYGAANNLEFQPSVWDSTFWAVANWRRTA